MNVTHVKIASKYVSAIVQTSKRGFCYVCNRNRLTSTSTNLYTEFVIKKNQVRYFSDEKDDDVSSKRELTGLKGIAGKYKIFQDFDSPVILDVDEERELLRSNPEQFEEVFTKVDPYSEMNLEHGETGVFDIEDLITVLKQENAQNVIAISVPPERRYVDYMVIVTGKSRKHVWALGDFIRGLYKRKKYENESIPQLEGEKESSWLALDLDNIALHIFTPEARKFYDLELLWSVGPEYDDLVNEKEKNYIQLLEQHSHPSLSDLTPTDTPVEQKTTPSLQVELG